MIDTYCLHFLQNCHFGNLKKKQITFLKSYPNSTVKIPPLVPEVESQSGLGSLLSKAEPRGMFLIVRAKFYRIMKNNTFQSNTCLFYLLFHIQHQPTPCSNGTWNTQRSA